jgi:phosphinothricin acetyltransferase
MNLEIRHASPQADAKNISELIQICINEKRTILNPYSEEEERHYLENLQPREAVFVAIMDGVFAGFAGIAPRWVYSDKLSHCGECGTWVMPNYRGIGVGRALWEEGIFPWCQVNGFSHLGAMVMSHNIGSIRFYEKMGFSIVGRHHKIVYWENEYLDTVEIELLLT